MHVIIPPAVTAFFQFIWLVIVVPTVLVGVWYAITLVMPGVDPLLGSLVLLIVYGVYLQWRSGSLARTSRSQKEALLHLSASEADLNQLFAHSPVPYCKINAKGIIVMANLAAVRLFDSTIEELPGKNLYEQISAEDQGHWDLLKAKLDKGISIQDQEMQVVSLRGREHWVLLSVFVKNIRDKNRLVTLVDVTQQKQIDQAKSEFVALASHQLRTPLAAIRFNTELLQTTVDAANDKQRAYFDKIERNTSNMISLINDFLSVSQLETGTYTADKATFVFDQYIIEVLEEYAGTQSQKQLNVPTSFAPEALSITADRRLLHIIVSNLISNAMKYTPAGGTVAVSYAVVEQRVVFTVQDTGMGIPARELPQLFTKFFRATNAKEERAEGTGLGLYIVKQAAEQMGGGITVESVEGEGSTFTVTLPLT